jgi:hypothetical protein
MTVFQNCQSSQAQGKVQMRAWWRHQSLRGDSKMKVPSMWLDLVT